MALSSRLFGRRALVAGLAIGLLARASPARAALPSPPWSWMLAPDEAPGGPPPPEDGDAAGFGVADGTEALESGQLTPPKLVGDSHIEYPADAPPITAPVDVEASIVVEPDGTVRDVEITRSGGPAFDAAVIAGLAGFRFEPARYRGQPVAVRIDYTQEFHPPQPAPPPAAGPELTSLLEGTLVTKGTRERIAAGEVVVRVADRELTAESDKDGRFHLSLPAGDFDVEVRAVGYQRFVVREHLVAGERLLVRYIVQRLSYDPYETVVVGKRDRQEVARTTLRGRELEQVAGTFGDPFRVITTLPGVSQAVSLLNYPIVRGTSPGNTGFLLDGTPVPQLFHLFAGPAVIHPEFIDSIDFYPGVFPARYGGYTGGIVDGHTRRPTDDEHRIDMDLDLTQAGGLVREPVGFGTVTVAGRYGYPGMILGLLNSSAYFSYWDYQLRFDTGHSPGFTAFAFGSFDEAGELNGGVKVASARTMFHRLDLRLTHPVDGGHDLASVVLGVDQLLSTVSADTTTGVAATTGTTSPGTTGPSGSGQSTTVPTTPLIQSFSGTLTSLTVAPRLESERTVGGGLSFRIGADGLIRRDQGPPGIQADGMLLTLQDQSYEAGAFLELPWQITDRLSVLPSVRGDVFVAGSTTQRSIDPRFSMRYRLVDVGDGGFVLKGGIGRYHQPPRFYIPVPGFEELALERGLLASTQSSLGFETPLGGAVDLDAQGYYDDMNPIILDLAPNSTTNDPNAQLIPPAWTPGQSVPQTILDSSRLTDQLLAKRRGRSYGLELMIRKRDVGRTFGWLSYTLSRSERLYEGQWVRYDFDRTHIVQLVAGLRMPRDWDVSTHLMFQTGRPVTTNAGYNTGLTSPFFRIDVRVDKRAVWQSWMLDFYVDVANVSLASEQLDSNRDASFRYVLPTAGVRAIF